MQLSKHSFLVFILFLTGCASSPQIEESSPPAGGFGFLVLNMSGKYLENGIEIANYGISEVLITSTKGKGLLGPKLVGGIVAAPETNNELMIFTLKPGSYNTGFGNLLGDPLKLGKNFTIFQIYPNQVTYIGDVDITYYAPKNRNNYPSFNIDIDNRLEQREDEIKRRILSKFPSIKRPLTIRSSVLGFEKCSTLDLVIDTCG